MAGRNPWSELRSRERALVHPRAGARLRVVLAYPNSYAVGMGNLGVHTVYRLLNAHPEVSCERVFLPPESSGRTRGVGAPLVSIESGTPVGNFDVLALSASFENDYPNVLRILDLAGLPLRAAARDERHPLVVMGGATVSINPEPVAAFLDVACIGEGEELVGPLVEEILSAPGRSALLRRLAARPGFYVPSLYRPRYERVGGGAARFAGLEACADAPPIVNKVRAALAGADRVAATAILSPDAEFGDRIMVEVARGCTKGCRYCWVGYSVLPFRVHAVDDVLAAVDAWQGAAARVGLVATALLDHPEIEAIADALRARGHRVFSPSLIISTLREPLLRAVVESGQETITVAPEAGSDRMRRLIMKRISNDEILEKVRLIFRTGARNLKNYIIVGLPGETEEDLQAIVDLGAAMREIMLQEARPRGRLGRITLSINCLIPKPGTPLQWAAQLTATEYRRRLRWLQRRVGAIPNLELDAMPPRAAEVQAVLSRGDRRVADLLELWHACGDWRAALRAWRAAGGPPLAEFLRAREPGEPVPWGHLRVGPALPALQTQWRRALAVAEAPAAEALA